MSELDYTCPADQRRGTIVDLVWMQLEWHQKMRRGQKRIFLSKVRLTQYTLPGPMCGHWSTPMQRRLFRDARLGERVQQ